MVLDGSGYLLGIAVYSSMYLLEVGGCGEGGGGEGEYKHRAHGPPAPPPLTFKAMAILN